MCAFAQGATVRAHTMEGHADLNGDFDRILHAGHTVYHETVTHTGARVAHHFALTTRVNAEVSRFRRSAGPERRGMRLR